MNELVDPQKDKGSKVGAIAAGAGGGTLLVVLANALPEGSQWKHTLVLVAPSISVTLSVIWLWVQKEIVCYIRNRKVLAVANRVKSRLLEALANQNTSEEHRLIIQQRLENLELMLADRDLKLIASLIDEIDKDVAKLESIPTKSTKKVISSVKTIEKSKPSPTAETAKVITPVVAIDKPKSVTIPDVDKPKSSIVDVDKYKSTTPSFGNKLKAIINLFRSK